MTPVRPLIITGHVNYSDSGASISEMHSVTYCRLRAAVQPQERERRLRGGAGQTDRADSGLENFCSVNICLHIGYLCCGRKLQNHHGCVCSSGQNKTSNCTL